MELNSAMFPILQSMNRSKAANSNIIKLQIGAIDDEFKFDLTSSYE